MSGSGLGVLVFVGGAWSISQRITCRAGREIESLRGLMLGLCKKNVRKA